MDGSLNFEFDITGLVNYQQALIRLRDKYPQFKKEVLYELAGRILERAMERSPVDTGTLRRSWKISEVEIKGNEFVIYIINDAKQSGQDESYASFVEEGHMTRNRKGFVEGVHMLSRSVDEIREELQAIFDLKFQKFCREMGL